MRPVEDDYMPIGIRLKPLPAVPVRDGLRLALTVSTAQRRVAMRKAPEALDHILMIERELQQPLNLEAAYQPDRLALVIQIFAMLEGKIKKQAPILGQPRVETHFDCMTGNGQRDMIGGECLGCTPKSVTRYLIEQDDRGECGVSMLSEDLDWLAA